MVESDWQGRTGVRVNEWKREQPVRSSGREGREPDLIDGEDGDPLDDHLLGRSFAEHAAHDEFAALVREMSPELAAYAAQRVQPSDVEDVVSVVFETVWRRWECAPGDYRRRRAWVFGVLKMTIKGHSSRLSDRASKAHLVADSLPYERDEADAGAEIEMRDLIDGLLADLPASHSSVFRMVVLDGYTAREVSETLGVSAGTIRMRVSRTRKMLRKRWPEQEGE